MRGEEEEVFRGRAAAGLKSEEKSTEGAMSVGCVVWPLTATECMVVEGAKLMTEEDEGKNCNERTVVVETNGRREMGGFHREQRAERFIKWIENNLSAGDATPARGRGVVII